MRLFKTFIFSFITALSLSACMMGEVVVDDTMPVYSVVYRTGFGYGYWAGSFWYPAPPGFIYRPGIRPTWGPHYRGHYRPPYRPAPPIYHGGHRGGGRYR